MAWEATMAADLLDDDGENRAVRAFLMQYGVAGLTVNAMRVHMSCCGFPFWPEWVQDADRQHLTKAGAQDWLRHLFALERNQGSTYSPTGLSPLIPFPGPLPEVPWVLRDGQAVASNGLGLFNLSQPGHETLRDLTVNQVLDVLRQRNAGVREVDRAEPVDMILYCPNCGKQHIDAPDPSPQFAPPDDVWTNPPHRSHLCHGCGCIWRPADVATNGVAELKTTGKDDNWPASHNEEIRAMRAHGVPAVNKPLYGHPEDSPTFDAMERNAGAQEVDRG